MEETIISGGGKSHTQRVDLLAIDLLTSKIVNPTIN